MKYAPNIHVVVSFDIEDQVRIFLQWPETQSGKVQFMGISGEASARVTTDVAICPLQRINEAESSFRRILAQVRVDCLVGVLLASSRGTMALGIIDGRQIWST
jgi:hypothetical protein